jgi:hypothetical protein
MSLSTYNELNKKINITSKDIKLLETNTVEKRCCNDKKMKREHDVFLFFIPNMVKGMI